MPARLPREKPKACTVCKLIHWLLCLGAKESRKKVDLFKWFARLPYFLISIKRPRRLIKIRKFDLAFFRGRRLIGVRRILMKYDFQPFFQTDLLLPILGNLVAVCQCWTIFTRITRSYSIMVPYVRHVYHVAIKICITNKQHMNNI